MRTLKAVEVASLLGVHPSVVYRLAAHGLIGHVRIGRAVRFPEAEVQKFLERATRPARVEASDAK
jgi:excisionase family DNA binding protein